MMQSQLRSLTAPLALLALLVTATPGTADEFGMTDIKDWEAAFDSVVKEGREAFVDPALGSNGVVCAQCHPNAANTHPETYPKFQKQLGRVVPMWEMINWCIRNPLEGKDLAPDDPRMASLQAYITFERRGVPLEPGKH